MSNDKKTSPLVTLGCAVVLLGFIMMPVPGDLMEDTYERMEREEPGSSSYCRKVNRGGLWKSYWDGVERNKLKQDSLLNDGNFDDGYDREYRDDRRGRGRWERVGY